MKDLEYEVELREDPNMRPKAGILPQSYQAAQLLIEKREESVRRRHGRLRQGTSFQAQGKNLHRKTRVSGESR